MAINDSGGAGSGPARGIGPDKVTGAAPADPDAPARGGCLKLGWGCLPVLLGFMLIPAGLFLQASSGGDSYSASRA